MSGVKPVVWMQTLREDRDVTGNRLLVLWALGMRMRKDGTGHASEPQLMVDIGVSEATVRRALKWAREVGYVVRTKRGHRLGDGTARASEYALTLPSQPVTRDGLTSVSTGHQRPVENGSQPVTAPSQPVTVPSQPVTRDGPRELIPRELIPRVPSFDGTPDGVHAHTPLETRDPFDPLEHIAEPFAFGWHLARLADDHDIDTGDENVVDLARMHGFDDGEGGIDPAVWAGYRHYRQPTRMGA